MIGSAVETKSALDVPEVCGIIEGGMAEDIKISPEVAAKCSGPDQFEKFDALVEKIFSISPKRSDAIRGEASVNPNPRGRPRKASRVPDASLRA